MFLHFAQANDIFTVNVRLFKSSLVDDKAKSLKTFQLMLFSRRDYLQIQKN